MRKFLFARRIKNRFKSDSFIFFVKKNKIFCLLICFLIVGIISGSVNIQNADQKTIKTISSLFLANISKNASAPFSEVFIVSLSTSCLFLGLEFLLGLSIWGGLTSALVLFFKGFSIGFCASYLCGTYALKGAVFYTVVLLPGTFVCSLAVLLLARESIRFSYHIFAQNLPKFANANKKPYKLKLYFLRTSFCFVLASIAAVLELLLFMTFKGLFAF
ncbi:MAG: hypothetical protein LBF33_03335 [Oscillospiraceae bacterium]|nr:hypothetical protein [Oscillospiraceae bacterium]